MADEVRLIDANSVCRKINDSLRLADEWADEAKRVNDTHAIKCATEARRSLMAMLSRIVDEPTIEAITREQFAEVAKQFISEFTANDGYGTLASATFLALFFGNLERRLFKHGDGDSDDEP